MNPGSDQLEANSRTSTDAGQNVRVEQPWFNSEAELSVGAPVSGDEIYLRRQPANIRIPL
jgi:hypothetical protein